WVRVIRIEIDQRAARDAQQKWLIVDRSLTLDLERRRVLQRLCFAGCQGPLNLQLSNVVRQMQRARLDEKTSNHWKFGRSRVRRIGRRLVFEGPVGTTGAILMEVYLGPGQYQPRQNDLALEQGQ